MGLLLPGVSFVAAGRRACRGASWRGVRTAGPVPVAARVTVAVRPDVLRRPLGTFAQ
ncbi:hypothetical protein T261_5078 [Streptomyces lydicus]|nr:hypothetical protein T261_5078 [Streptomyces lydicus]